MSHPPTVAQLFKKSLEIPGGEAALEIGVFKGDSTIPMLNILKNTNRKSFRLFGVDPYGNKPFHLGDKTLENLDYNDQAYLDAKKNLAPYEQHILFVSESEYFLNHELPNYYWWHDGKKYPEKERYISFVFVDGEHREDIVLAEAEKIYPYLVDGALMLFDDVGYLGSFHEKLKKNPNMRYKGDHVGQALWQWIGR